MITRELRISLAVIRISAFFGIVMVGNALWRFGTNQHASPTRSAFLGTNVSVCEPEMPELSTKLPIST